MYLVIDRGNTRMKLALFSHGKDPYIRVLDPVSTHGLGELLDEIELYHGKGSIRRGIYSSVVQDSEGISALLQNRMELMVLTSDTPLPIRIVYGTPETLGHDRIAAAVGARSMFPGNDVLSIDAGTCITFDFTNDRGEYLGGGISPGIGMRFKALHTFTSKLPLVSRDEEATLVGASTKGSILSGVLLGVVAEVDGIIDQYRILHPGLRIILTGGDANYFEKNLKNDIFAVPNLVLVGLKEILHHNVEK